MMPLDRKRLEEARALDEKYHVLFREWLAKIGIDPEKKHRLRGILVPLAFRVRGASAWEMVDELNPTVIVEGFQGERDKAVIPVGDGKFKIVEDVAAEEFSEGYEGCEVWVSVPRAGMEPLVFGLKGHEDEKVIIDGEDYQEAWVYLYLVDEPTISRSILLTGLLRDDFTLILNRIRGVATSLCPDPDLRSLAEKSLEKK